MVSADMIWVDPGDTGPTFVVGREAETLLIYRSIDDALSARFALDRVVSLETFETPKAVMPVEGTLPLFQCPSVVPLRTTGLGSALLLRILVPTTAVASQRPTASAPRLVVLAAYRNRLFVHTEATATATSSIAPIPFPYR